MPVTWTVKEVTAEASAETEGFIRQAVRVFNAHASEPSTPVAAETATGLPGIGAAHPDDSSLKVRTRKATPVDQTLLFFRVEFRYDENIWLENPLSMPTQVSYDDENYEEAYYKDADGALAQNTAGDPFDELPLRDASITVITLEKNVTHTQTYNDYEAMRNCVNSGSTTIDGHAYAARELKVKKISLGKIQVMNGTQFRQLLTTLIAKPGGWDQTYESRGRRELVSSSPITIPDPETGRPIDYLWPLNENGSKTTAVSDEGFAIVLKPYTSTSLASLL